MISKNSSWHPLSFALRLLAVLALLLPGALGAATSISAQTSETADMSIWARGCEDNYPCIGAIFTVSTTDGSFIGSCTLAGDPNNTAVIQHCSVTVPLWTTVVVTQDVSTISPGTSPVENPIYFDTTDGRTQASHWGVGFQNKPKSGAVTSAGSSDVAVVATENGQPIYDACFILLEYGNEGCDENRDGKITYEDVPLGTYTLRQTRDLGSSRSIPDSTITVTGSVDADGWERKYVSVSGAQTSPQAIDISLITRDPDDGHLLTGACYVLVNYSNEGCDENNDGQVTFAQIPPGTYTVRQTQTPDGYPVINDYDINVQPLGNLPNGEVLPIPLGFVVRQAVEQNASDTLNVSVILIDYTTGKKLDSGVCVELVGASNVGCDQDLVDGQIDFLDVPAGGPYELRFSNVPDGLRVGAGATEPYQVWIMPDTWDSSIVFAFILFDEDETQVINPTTDAEATLLLTLRGCPEGIDPNITNPATACTIPLDAPDRAAVTFPDAMSHEMFIPMSGAARQTDGTYQVTVPANLDLQVAYFEPEVRDTFLSVGHESMSNYGNPIINLAPGETGHIYIYYYYTDSGSLQPSSPTAQATILMYMRGCPEGFDPNTGDFFASCTEPLDAPDASFLYHGGDGQGGMNIMWMDRQYDGAYVFEAGPYTMNVTLSGLAPVLRDGYTVTGTDGVSGDQYTINLVDGETREVWVFYYYWP